MSLCGDLNLRFFPPLLSNPVNRKKAGGLVVIAVDKCQASISCLKKNKETD